jgi:hypothetical protein
MLTNGNILLLQEYTLEKYKNGRNSFEARLERTSHTINRLLYLILP